MEKFTIIYHRQYSPENIVLPVYMAVMKYWFKSKWEFWEIEKSYLSVAFSVLINIFNSENWEIEKSYLNHSFSVFINIFT